MKIISFAIRPRAVTILALTSFLLWSASHLFAHDNSAASAQNGDDYTFSHDLNAETITFEAVNPSNQAAAGRMTVTITGAINGYRLWDEQSVVGDLSIARQVSAEQIYSTISSMARCPWRAAELASNARIA